MKNFFEKKINKGNPFVDEEKNKGEGVKTMADEIKENEQDIIEEQEENNEVEETSTEAEIAEENTRSNFRRKCGFAKPGNRKNVASKKLTRRKCRHCRLVRN